MKVYASANSEPAMRVMACLIEKQLEFKFINVDMKAGEHKREPYLSINPFGLVPAFEDGELKLFESRAITQYIANEYPDHGTTLIHKDTKKRAICQVWLEVESHQFDPAASRLTWELVLKPMLGAGNTDAAAVEESEAKLAKVLDVYESRLGKSKYLAGDCFSLADLQHLPHLHYLKGTRSWKVFESRPRVCHWAGDITARPAWSKVVAAMTSQTLG